MARHKEKGKSAFDRAVLYLEGKVLERHKGDTGSVWGIVKRGKTVFRVRPQFGLDVVEKRETRWRKTKRVLDAKQLGQWLAAEAAPKNAARLKATVRRAA